MFQSPRNNLPCDLLDLLTYRNYKLFEILFFYILFKPQNIDVDNCGRINKWFFCLQKKIVTKYNWLKWVAKLGHSPMSLRDSVWCCVLWRKKINELYLFTRAREIIPPPLDSNPEIRQEFELLVFEFCCI